MGDIRSVKSRQSYLTINYIAVGSDGKVGGLDLAAIEKVEKLGEGIFKIVMKKRTHGIYQVAGLASLSKGKIPYHMASDDSSITIGVTDSEGEHKDGDFNLSYLLHETRYIY
jgi:lysozyme family protein